MSTNPEVDSLIKELGGILQQNREKRNAADAMLLGIQQGKARAAQEQANAGQLKTAISSGYGGDRAYSLKGQSPKASDISPSTTAAGRTAIASKYAQQRGDTGAKTPYNFLQENDTYTPPQDAGALDEQKKRFTQRLMLERGQAGGPLGGAGAGGPPPELNTPTTAGMDPALVGAVSGAGGPVPQMNPGGPETPVAAQPSPSAAGGSPFPSPQQPDTALLDAYRQYQLQRGGV